jgi:hypothetical protein
VNAVPGGPLVVGGTASDMQQEGLVKVVLECTGTSIHCL